MPVLGGDAVLFVTAACSTAPVAMLELQGSQTRCAAERSNNEGAMFARVHALRTTTATEQHKAHPQVSSLLSFTRIALHVPVHHIRDCGGGRFDNRCI